MFRHLYLFTAIATLAIPGLSAAEDRSPENYEVHDPDRAKPPVVDPGPAQGPVPAPSDAIILFDGSGFDAWETGNGNEAGWELIGSAMRVVPGSGDIQTKQTFGDVQLHVEFKTYAASPGSGQHKSNSGVFIGPYEIQVLDSYQSDTYADGMVGALYGQYPPLVNASRPSGEWQTHDIIYRAPEFDDAGELLEPARVTVLFNGILVQDSEKLTGPTTHTRRPPYSAHGDVPIRLQDHNDDPMQFRNIWVRELK